MARDYIERLMESGDLTVERLLIEDWADRRRLKLGFAHSVKDFNNLIITLARDLRQGLQEFERHQLREYSNLARSSPDWDLDRDLSEIIDGQLFEAVDSVSDRYRVREEFWDRQRLIEVDPLDPAAPVPADLAPVTNRLAALDAGNFWREVGPTAEEHRFDELAPILARFAPQVLSTPRQN